MTLFIAGVFADINSAFSEALFTAAMIGNVGAYVIGKEREYNALHIHALNDALIHFISAETRTGTVRFVPAKARHTLPIAAAATVVDSF
ncbi:MAG: hypothetical protein JXA41_11355 [Deltaproteobacteria bacterium]|nr:hypothetical protein [Deltaproteobacteria bacterium]